MDKKGHFMKKVECEINVKTKTKILTKEYGWCMVSKESDKATDRDG